MDYKIRCIVLSVSVVIGGTKHEVGELEIAGETRKITFEQFDTKLEPGRREFSISGSYEQFIMIFFNLKTSKREYKSITDEEFDNALKKLINLSEDIGKAFPRASNMWAELLTGNHTFRQVFRAFVCNSGESSGIVPREDLSTTVFRIEHVLERAIESGVKDSFGHRARLKSSPQHLISLSIEEYIGIMRSNNPFLILHRGDANGVESEELGYKKIGTVKIGLRNYNLVLTTRNVVDRSNWCLNFAEDVPSANGKHPLVTKHVLRTLFDLRSDRFKGDQIEFKDFVAILTYIKNQLEIAPPNFKQLPETFLEDKSFRFYVEKLFGIADTNNPPEEPLMCMNGDRETYQRIEHYLQMLVDHRAGVKRCAYKSDVNSDFYSQITGLLDVYEKKTKGFVEKVVQRTGRRWSDTDSSELEPNPDGELLEDSLTDAPNETEVLIEDLKVGNSRLSFMLVTKIDEGIATKSIEINSLSPSNPPNREPHRNIELTKMLFDFARHSDRKDVPELIQRISDSEFERIVNELTKSCANHLGLLCNVIVFDELIQYWEHNGRQNTGMVYKKDKRHLFRTNWSIEPLTKPGKTVGRIKYFLDKITEAYKEGNIDLATMKDGVSKLKDILAESDKKQASSSSAAPLIPDETHDSVEEDLFEEPESELESDADQELGSDAEPELDGDKESQPASSSRDIPNAVASAATELYENSMGGSNEKRLLIEKLPVGTLKFNVRLVTKTDQRGAFGSHFVQFNIVNYIPPANCPFFHKEALTAILFNFIWNNAKRTELAAVSQKITPDEFMSIVDQLINAREIACPTYLGILCNHLLFADLIGYYHHVKHQNARTVYHCPFAPLTTPKDTADRVEYFLSKMIEAYQKDPGQFATLKQGLSRLKDIFAESSKAQASSSSTTLGTLATKKSNNRKLLIPKLKIGQAEFSIEALTTKQSEDSDAHKRFIGYNILNLAEIDVYRQPEIKFFPTKAFQRLMLDIMPRAEHRSFVWIERIKIDFYTYKRVLDELMRTKQDSFKHYLGALCNDLLFDQLIDYYEESLKGNSHKMDWSFSHLTSPEETFKRIKHLIERMAQEWQEDPEQFATLKRGLSRLKDIFEESAKKQALSEESDGGVWHTAGGRRRPASQPSSSSRDTSQAGTKTAEPDIGTRKDNTAHRKFLGTIQVGEKLYSFTEYSSGGNYSINLDATPKRETGATSKESFLVDVLRISLFGLEIKFNSTYMNRAFINAGQNIDFNPFCQIVKELVGLKEKALPMYLGKLFDILFSPELVRLYQELKRSQAQPRSINIFQPSDCNQTLKRLDHFIGEIISEYISDKSKFDGVKPELKAILDERAQQVGLEAGWGFRSQQTRGGWRWNSGGEDPWTTSDPWASSKEQKPDDSYRWSKEIQAGESKKLLKLKVRADHYAIHQKRKQDGAYYVDFICDYGFRPTNSWYFREKVLRATLFAVIDSDREVEKCRKSIGDEEFNDIVDQLISAQREASGPYLGKILDALLTHSFIDFCEDDKNDAFFSPAHKKEETLQRFNSFVRKMAAEFQDDKDNLKFRGCNYRLIGLLEKNMPDRPGFDADDFSPTASDRNAYTEQNYAHFEQQVSRKGAATSSRAPNQATTNPASPPAATAIIGKWVGRVRVGDIDHNIGWHSHKFVSDSAFIEVILNLSSSNQSITDQEFVAIFNELVSLSKDIKERSSDLNKYHEYMWVEVLANEVLIKCHDCFVDGSIKGGSADGFALKGSYATTLFRILYIIEKLNELDPSVLSPEIRRLLAKSKANPLPLDSILIHDREAPKEELIRTNLGTVKIGGASYYIAARNEGKDANGQKQVGIRFIDSEGEYETPKVIATLFAVEIQRINDETGCPDTICGEKIDDNAFCLALDVIIKSLIIAPRGLELLHETLMTTFLQSYFYQKCLNRSEREPMPSSCFIKDQHDPSKTISRCRDFLVAINLYRNKLGKPVPVMNNQFHRKIGALIIDCGLPTGASSSNPGAATTVTSQLPLAPYQGDFGIGPSSSATHRPTTANYMQATNNAQSVVFSQYMHSVITSRVFPAPQNLTTLSPDAPVFTPQEHNLTSHQDGYRPQTHRVLDESQKFLTSVRIGQLCFDVFELITFYDSGYNPGCIIFKNANFLQQNAGVKNDYVLAILFGLVEGAQQEPILPNQTITFEEFTGILDVLINTSKEAQGAPGRVSSFCLYNVFRTLLDKKLIPLFNELFQAKIIPNQTLETIILKNKDETFCRIEEVVRRMDTEYEKDRCNNAPHSEDALGIQVLKAYRATRPRMPGLVYP